MARSRRPHREERNVRRAPKTVPRPRRNGDPGAATVDQRLAGVLDLHRRHRRAAAPARSCEYQRRSFHSGQALWGRDFVNVYSSGALALQGRLDILYDVEAYRAFQLGLFDGELQHHNYSYPPVSLLYTWLFALLPYPAAWVAWLALTGAPFASAARPLLRGVGLPGWVALLAPASIINLWAGHYGFLIGALWLFAWRRCLGARRWPAC